MDISSLGAISGSSGLPGGLNPQALMSKSPVEQRKAVAAQFEAILMRQFLSKSVGSIMGGDDTPQGSIYGYLLTDSLAQSMAAGGGMGLAKVIEQQLGGASAPHSASPAKPLSSSTSSS